MHYLPWHYEEWTNHYKVRKLDRITRLIFYDLLVYLWERGGQVDDDPEELCYHLRITPEEWQKARQELLKGKFIAHYGGEKRIYNHLLMLELERVNDQIAKRSIQGAKAVRKRWEKRNDSA